MTPINTHQVAQVMGCGIRPSADGGSTSLRSCVESSMSMGQACTAFEELVQGWQRVFVGVELNALDAVLVEDLADALVLAARELGVSHAQVGIGGVDAGL